MSGLGHRETSGYQCHRQCDRRLIENPFHRRHSLGNWRSKIGVADRRKQIGELDINLQSTIIIFKSLVVVTFVVMVVCDRSSERFSVDREDQLRIGSFFVKVFAKFRVGGDEA